MLYHQSLFKFFKFGSSVKKSKLHCFSHLAKALVLHEGVTDLRKKTPKNFDGLMFLPRDLKFFGYEVAKQIHVVRFQPTTILTFSVKKRSNPPKIMANLENFSGKMRSSLLS